jgi:hypothetical protein
MGGPELPDVRPRRLRKGFLPVLAKVAVLFSAALLLGVLLPRRCWYEVSRAARDAAGRFRRLTAAFGFDDDTWVIVRMTDDTLIYQGSTLSGSEIWGLYAGLTITEVQLNIDGNANGYQFTSATALMRVVRESVNTTGAQAGECAQDDLENSLHIAHVAGDWAEAGAVFQYGASLSQAKFSNLDFKMGGTYRLCYSNDGLFQGANVDVLYPSLQVAGVYDDRPECVQNETCLTKRPYRCYLLRQAYANMHDNYSVSTSCVVDFSYEGADYQGLLGRGSWSEAFSTTYDDNGLVVSVTPSLCAAASDEPADFLCKSGGCFSGDAWVDAVDTQPSGGYFSLPVGHNQLSGTSFKANTVAACYCPGGHGSPACSLSTFFVQQVGVLHFYVSKVCMSGFDAEQCVNDFTGVSPQHSFAVRVECPTDACTAGGSSRMKLVVQKAANDLPSYAPSGCASAAHGMYEWSDGQTTLVLPLDVNPDVAVLAGGNPPRQDYKRWNWWTEGNYAESRSGFLFEMGSTDHELRSGENRQAWDVCYCDDLCDSDENWFKVGQMRFAPFQLVSTLGSNLSFDNTSSQEEFLVEYAMQPGMIGFYRPPQDHGVMALQENGVIKLVSDPQLQADDAFCASADYDATLVGGLATWEDATTSFLGTASADGTRLLFNSGDTTNQVTVQRAGYVAICYCAFIDTSGVPPSGTLADGECLDDHWVLTHHITVRGPGLGQSWEYSTHVVFSFEYTGWGLSSGDKVRVIPSDSDCSGDPTAAATVTGLSLQCPDPCSMVGDVTSDINGDISVSLLADDAYECDKNNENCGNNDIKNIVVQDEYTTLVEFENPHTLSDGDFIQIGSLGDNIVCSPDDPQYICNDEKLAVLKGQYRLVDGGSNSVSAPDDYVAGHVVTTVSGEPSMVTIPVGWPASTRPTFMVEYLNSKRGRWNRHSKATTAEEIMGTQAKQNMKVCWKYAQKNEAMSPQYVAQVGTISLVDPFALADCQVSLTSRVKEQGLGAAQPYAPMIVSFKTGSAQTGARYSEVRGTTRLRIIFFETLKLDPRFGDGGSIVEHTGEDELTEAKQYICGKLFKEMWSSDTEMGFPLPKGCYYQVYGNSREIVVLFDARNGLRAGQDYQLVLNGVVQTGAVKSGEYVEILTMDDTDVYPYRAIERGLAALNKDPEDGAFGDSGVMFSSEGLTVLEGSDEGTIELLEGTTLTIQLRGDSSGGGITAGSILRLFMWPLTQWSMESTCSVACTDYDVISAPCGDDGAMSCKGSAVVTNFQRNYLEVKLPDTMTTIDETIAHILTFSGLQFPTGGFFPERVGAEISMSDDKKPHYIESIGAFLYKPPDEGQMVGKLVNNFGDGNANPFAGDQGNILYANIVLAATLYSASQTGDAKMTLTLPTGYVCVEPEDVDGESGWKDQEDLGVFGGEIPQGIGAPDDPDSASRGWTVSANTCVYELRQNSAIFAGSSVMVRVTVDNPTEALQRGDDANQWTVTLESKGDSTVSVAFPAVAFATVEEQYSTSVSVLGHITDASLVPTNFAVTPDAFQPSEGYLRVFFRTEQSTGVFSRVHLRAPETFGAGFFNCRAQDLEDSYYATRNGDNTRRLPGIISCAYGTDPYSHVEVMLTGEIQAGARYAFSVYAVNPDSFSPGPLNGWMIYTLSSEGYLIDGSSGTLTFVDPHADSLDWGGSVTESFSMYRTELNTALTTCAAVSISNMLPYSISSTPATVTVSPLCVPEAVETTLRIIAPHGFVWDSSAGDFSGLPGGQPYMDGNVLLWPTTALYQSRLTTTYSFDAAIRVPDVSPSSTVNDFIFEFGYNATTEQGRASAASVAAPPVRALLNAALDYESNLAEEDTMLIFQIETITDITAGGQLTITGPEGFVFDDVCSPEAAPKARGSPYDVDHLANYLTLPPDVTCSYSSTEGDAFTGIAGTSVVTVTAGSQGIPAGLYRFQLEGTNPSATSPPQEDPSSTCGYSCCWSFATAAQGAILDAPLLIPCFGVNGRMSGGGMPVLTDAEARDTLRDDRPLMYNPLVFVVSLSQDAKYAGYMRIRGPEGVVFQEDCQEDVQTEGTKVFGDGTELDTNIYTAWPTDVKVTSCRGEGPDAYLRIEPVNEGSSGLLALLVYPFRIAIYMNPATPPALNQWTIEFTQDGFQADATRESTPPFDGFQLWTFSGTSLHAVSTARSTPDDTAAKFANPVTITFNPQNTLDGPGSQIVVTAPELFEFAHTDGSCQVIIQPVGNTTVSASGAPNPNYFGPPSLIWGDGDTECVVDTAAPTVLTVTVLAETAVEAGTDYQITVYVHNPTVESTTVGDTVVIGDWTLQTHQSDTMTGLLPTFRDLATIPGYVIRQRPNDWMLLNSGDSNGQAKVLDLYFQVSFPNNLESGDKIVVQAPRDFKLEDAGAPGQCMGFSWDPDTAEGNVLPNSHVNCTEGELTFSVSEPQNIKEGVLMKFRLDTVNPVETPHVMLNNWIVSHLDPDAGIMATEALAGWDITSQLDEVDIDLVGESKAAGQISSIAISFVPVSTADELEFTALAPSGISFTGAVAISTGHEVISTSDNVIRIQAAISKGVKTYIVIDEMTLGAPGGQTKFDLVTKLNNGDQMDEALGFDGGFVQPGLLTVSGQDIKSEFNLDPAAHPVSSLWDTRMVEMALVKFVISNTMATAKGHTLVITSYSDLQPSGEYQLFAEDFMVADVSGGTEVPSYDVKASGTRLTAVLDGPLLADTDYEVCLKVRTPPTKGELDSTWRIEVFSDYEEDDQQLHDTNDATTTAFRLVDSVILEVTSLDAPPEATVTARITVTLASTTPSEMFIVAPLGFNFTDDCLVQGGWNGEIVACTPVDSVAGRATARLTCQSGGITGEVSGIQVSVTSPAASAADPSWYVSVVNSDGEQEGWGHDPVGFSVAQMLGSTVVYSGVPDMSGLMIVGFVTQKQIPSQGKIRVGHPNTFIILCEGAFFEQLGLRGDFTCAAGDGFFELTIDYPISIGQQAFAVTSTPPAAEPVDNSFYIKLMDTDGGVIDAAMNIQGLKIQHGLPMTALELTWSNSEPGERSTVSLGFELVSDLPEKDPPVLHELVVQLPPDFAQQVTNALHIEWSDKSLPYVQATPSGLLGGPLAPAWLDASDPSSLNFFLDEAAAEDLQVGTYRFSFPVVVPALIPAYNVFTVTLCGPPAVNATYARCTGAQDSRALVSFPITGFELGEIHPTALKDSANSGVLRRVSLGAAPLILAAALLAVLC